MNGKCVFCDEHVPSGEAFLVLRGQLAGDGTFRAEEVEGAACVGHCDEIEELKSKLAEAQAAPTTIGVSSFPLTFKM